MWSVGVVVWVWCIKGRVKKNDEVVRGSRALCWF